MDDAQVQTPPLALYKRLLRHTLRYRLRFLVGVLSGLVVGGSVFAMLKVSWDLLQQVESGAGAVAAAAAPGAPAAPAAPAAAGCDAATGWARHVQAVARDLGIPIARADGRVTWQFLALGIAALLAVVLGRQAAMYLNQYCLRWLGARVVRDLRDLQFESIEAQSLSYHGRVDVGRLISRCVADTGMVEHVVSNAVADISRAPFEILGAIAFVVLFAWRKDMFDMLAVAVVGFPLCIVPLVVLGRRVRGWTHRALQRIGDLVARMHESFTCIRVVKAFHTEDAETGRFREENRRYFKAVMRAVRVEMLMGPAMELASVALGGVFLVACTLKGLRLSDIAVVAVAGVVVYKPIRQLSRIVPMLERGAAALGRVFETTDLNERLPEDPHPVRRAAFEREMVFEDVSFRYGPSGEPVVRHVSFTLPRGGVVAVVGATGSGKTTLANLLARFYDPTEGRVTLDGVDLRRLHVGDLRRLVGVLTQETILLRHHRLQRGLRQRGRDPRADRGRRRPGPCARLHRRPSRRLRPQGRREGLRPQRRRAPAHRDFARHPAQPADPDPRRGHQRAGHRHRAPGAGGDHAPDGQPHDLRHRPPPQHDPARRPDPGDGPGRDRRARHPRRALHRWRRVPPPLRHAVRGRGKGAGSQGSGFRDERPGSAST